MYDNAEELINMGDLCLECRNDTSFGSGRFVNRIPCYRETEEGYLCEECYTIDAITDE